ncbi:hypothetical protein GHT06_015510 [Daphnia sinensis]|uniref:CUB domain-containing protein n=1 Tax=Daphnia sinensis TaxID=1820382 RepID=A0AAD5PT00_9CRUS|nr:hypothetical protein GHT06_015510 [Daphnia sinensis]
MPKCCSIFLFVFLSLQTSLACYEDNQLTAVTQQSRDYLMPSYGFSPPSTWNDGQLHYYHPITGLPVSSAQYEGRTWLDGIQRTEKPQTKYTFRNSDDEEQPDQAGNRFIFNSFLKTGMFNNRFSPANVLKPFANFASRIPIALSPNLMGQFDACTTLNGDSGICATKSVCSLFGGRPSGSCIFGKICCMNTVNTCGGSVTLNNTYWQSSPKAIDSPTICALNVRLDTKFVEQSAKSICQLRLDFISFSIDQPTAGTCVDKFQVDGASTTPPIICGDNSGQHMYLDVPSSDLTSTDIQLLFNFARTAAPISRSWNIQIVMLPCGAHYLAPVDCLQYFASSTGRIKSFNWKDVPVSATRQLNNQNYNICFRTELIDRQKANQICFSVCPTTNAGAGYSITTNAIVPGNSLLGVGTNTQGYCTYDFLAIIGATDAVTGLVADRFCGEKFNTVRAPGSAINAQLCTRVKPFRVTYATDRTESEVIIPALVLTPADINNVGFCLDYQEKAD